MHILAFVVVVTALVSLFWFILKKQREQAGVSGWIKDQDLDGKGRKLYRDRETGVVCKPDIVESNKVIEVKSASVGNKPRWVDILQLALQMKATGSKRGALWYDQGKKFDFTNEHRKIRSATKIAHTIVQRMRWHLKTKTPPKATPTANRCRSCKYGGGCSKSMRQ